MGARLAHAPARHTLRLLLPTLAPVHFIRVQLLDKVDASIRKQPTVRGNYEQILGRSLEALVNRAEELKNKWQVRRLASPPSPHPLVRCAQAAAVLCLQLMPSRREELAAALPVCVFSFLLHAIQFSISNPLCRTSMCRLRSW